MPLVGYNYASGNYKRMRKVSYFSWKTALIMSACFIICFAVLAPQILHLFIPAADTLHFPPDRKRSTLVTFASGSRMRIMNTQIIPESDPAVQDDGQIFQILQIEFPVA